MESIDGTIGCIQKWKAHAELIFFAGYIPWLLWKMQSMSMLVLPDRLPIGTIIHFTLLLILCVSALLMAGRDFLTIIWAIFVCIGVAVWLSTGDFRVIDLAILLQAGRASDFKRIAKASLIVVGCSAMIIVFCSLSGVIQNYPFMRGDGSVRWGLGFRYTTYLPHLYLYLVLTYLYLRGPLVRGVELAVLLLIDFVLYLATDSRNPFILVIVAIAGVAALRGGILSKEKAVAAISFAGQWAPVMLSVGVILTSMLYSSNNALLVRVNSLLSNRLYQTHESLITYGITAFGTEIEWSGNGLVETESGMLPGYEADSKADPNFVDSAYAELLLRCGIATLALVLSVSVLAGKYARRQGDVQFSIILIIIAVHASIDPQMFEIVFNPFLFLIWRLAGKELALLYHRNTKALP